MCDRILNLQRIQLKKEIIGDKKTRETYLKQIIKR